MSARSNSGSKRAARRARICINTKPAAGGAARASSLAVAESETVALFEEEIHRWRRFICDATAIYRIAYTQTLVAWHVSRRAQNSRGGAVAWLECAWHWHCLPGELALLDGGGGGGVQERARV